MFDKSDATCVRHALPSTKAVLLNEKDHDFRQGKSRARAMPPWGMMIPHSHRVIDKNAPQDLDKSGKSAGPRIELTDRSTSSDGQ